MAVPRILEKDRRALELYSGIGGMHYALAAASVQYDVVAACDINTTANEIYKHNFPNTNLLQLNLDGFSVNDLDKINADLFLISPPCQPFTRVGLQGDEKDKRSKSFLHLLDLMTRLNNLPTYILLENVKGFEASNTHQLFLDTLARCNYHWQEFLLSPVQFGIPNSRLRYYLIAKLKHLPFCFHSTNEIMEIFPVKLSLLQSHFPNCIHGPTSDSLMKGNCEKPVDIPIKTLDFFLESNLKEKYLEPFLIPNKILCKYCMVMDIVRPDEKHSCCFTKAYGHYVEGTGSVLQNNPHISLSKIFEKASQMNIEDEAKKIALLKNLNLRYFTPQEIANIHYFPKTFAFPSSTTIRQQYRTLGNSLNVFVVASLLQLLVLNNIK